MTMMRWLLLEAAAQTAGRFDPSCVYQRLEMRRASGVARVAVAWP
jgi:hypothetical protein